MSVIPLELNDNGTFIHIDVRASDGYVNATTLCANLGKEWKTFWRLQNTKQYAQTLSHVEQKGIIFDPRNADHTHDAKYLVYRGHKNQPTWVHPDIGEIYNNVSKYP